MPSSRRPVQPMRLRRNLVTPTAQWKAAVAVVDHRMLHHIVVDHIARTGHTDYILEGHLDYIDRIEAVVGTVLGRLVVPVVVEEEVFVPLVVLVEQEDPDPVEEVGGYPLDGDQKVAVAEVVAAAVAEVVAVAVVEVVAVAAGVAHHC